MRVALDPVMRFTLGIAHVYIKKRMVCYGPTDLRRRVVRAPYVCACGLVIVSPNAGILLKRDGAELLLAHVLAAEMSARRVDFDLPNVSIASVLVVGEDRDLYKVRAQFGP